MIVTIFRSRLRPEHQEHYERVAPHIEELARRMPGFISIKTFSSPDGERVSIVEFESEDAQKAWREQPEHREAQRLGYEKFYSEYRIQVCRVKRDYGKKPQSRATQNAA
jgi:heme-degrading monooxygenase HmoA